MVAHEDDASAAGAPDHAKYELPKEGGISWFVGGTPLRDLPPPCVACIRFVAALTEDELKQLAIRARAALKATS